MIKRFFFLVSIGFLLTGTIYAQWSSLNTGTNYILFDINFPPGQDTVGYSAGRQNIGSSEGIVIKTTDAGSTWTEIVGGSGTVGFEAVCFTSVDTGFVGGLNNYFAKTTDGGLNWTSIVLSNGVSIIRDIEFRNADTGAVAVRLLSGQGSVYYTSDGGDTWTEAVSIPHKFRDICYANDTTLYGVGITQQISKSTDGGSHWVKKYTGTDGRFFYGVDFDENYGVVAGDHGIVMYTEDGGSNWSNKITVGGQSYTHYGVFVFNDDSTYIDGSDEKIHKTTNGGVTWDLEDDGGGSIQYYDITFSDNLAGYACGSSGTIKRKAPPLQADFEADETTVCQGSSVQFTDKSNNADSWYWVFEGGNPATSTDQNPAVTYNTLGDFDVTLTATIGSESDTEIKINYISVITTPDAPDKPQGDTAVCSPATYQYTIASVSYADSYTWSIYPSNAGTISGTGTTGTVNTDEDYEGDFYVKVKASNQCGTSNWSDSLKVSTSFLPVIYQLCEGGTICPDGSVEITQDGSTEGVTYELFYDQFTTGIIIDGTGDSISFGFFSDEGDYTSTGTNGSCTDYMDGTAVITVNPLPDPAPKPEGDTAVCAYQTTDYSIDPIAGADTVYWTLDPAEAGTILGDWWEISIEWSTDFEGTAKLTVKGSNECGDGDESDPLSIEVSSAPSPEITGPEQVCKEEEAEYTTVDNPGSTYEWLVTSGEIIQGEGTYQITVAWGSPGNGYVELTETSADSCTAEADTMFVTINECTTISEHSGGKLSIYPNPARDVLNISSSMIIRTVKLYNLTGQEVATVLLNKRSGSIDTSKLKPGIYLLQIEATEGIESKRIIIE
jgi:photosystem II stability/assembly factor-like uncharacterized protein